jgi:hypothetical protein
MFALVHTNIKQNDILLLKSSLYPYNVYASCTDYSGQNMCPQRSTTYLHLNVFGSIFQSKTVY